MSAPLVVPDASVILKWALPPEDEPEAERALTLLDAIIDGRVRASVPALWLYEIGNTVARRFPEHAPEWIALLVKLDLDVSAPSSRWLDTSLALTRERGVTFHDASYHAIAVLGNGVFRMVQVDRVRQEPIGGQHVDGESVEHLGRKVPEVLGQSSARPPAPSSSVEGISVIPIARAAPAARSSSFFRRSVRLRLATCSSTPRWTSSGPRSRTYVSNPTRSGQHSSSQSDRLALIASVQTTRATGSASCGQTVSNPPRRDSVITRRATTAARSGIVFLGAAGPVCRFIPRSGIGQHDIRYGTSGAALPSIGRRLVRHDVGQHRLGLIDCRLDLVDCRLDLTGRR